MGAPKDPKKRAEWLRKISAKGRKHTDETRRKIGDAQRGSKSKNYGKRLPDETKRKISAAMRGRPKSEETKRRLSAAHKGKIIPQEMRDRISRK